MLASACCPRAAVAVSALASPAGRSDRVSAVKVARRRGFRFSDFSRHPSRLRSASDASDDASDDASPASLAALIDRLRAAAGTKNGTDLDEHAEAKVKAIVREISARDDSALDPNTIDLAGTNWDLLYSDSPGNSSGKLGPFVGRVTQRFSDERGSGKYENVVRLGPLTLSLAAVAAPVSSDEKNESLRVTFVDLAVDVFGKRALNKPFPRTRRDVAHGVRLRRDQGAVHEPRERLRADAKRTMSRDARRLRIFLEERLSDTRTTSYVTTVDYYFLNYLRN